jgi:hypothetical protein
MAGTIDFSFAGFRRFRAVTPRGVPSRPPHRPLGQGRPTAKLHSWQASGISTFLGRFSAVAFDADAVRGGAQFLRVSKFSRWIARVSVS